jgi:hypothetical protein
MIFAPGGPCRKWFVGRTGVSLAVRPARRPGRAGEVWVARGADHLVCLISPSGTTASLPVKPQAAGSGTSQVRHIDIADGRGIRVDFVFPSAPCQ